MSLRRFLLLGWMACTSACFEGDDAAVQDQPAPADARSLMAEGDMQVYVVAGTMQALRVRLVDASGEPIEGEPVAFGLWGRSEGASLVSADASTDHDGIAEATLMAGRTVSSFQVRASAEGAPAVFFDIDVVEAQAPQLTVQVRYDGQRPIQSRSVAVVAGMDCDLLLANLGDVKVAYALGSNDAGLSFDEPLGAGRAYAVAAWGSDDTNSKLASGCRNFTAPVTGDPDEADVTLEVALDDLPFSVADRYDITLSIDVATMLKGLTATADAAVDGALAGASGASFLLDLGLPKLAGSLRQSLGLDAALEAGLAAAGTGPAPFAEALAAALVTEADGIALQGQMVTAQGDQESELAVDQIVATRAGETLRPLDAGAVPLTGPIVLDATYVDARAAFVIDTCTLPLGYGSYAAWLLDRVQAAPSVYASALGQAGCRELGQLVDAHSAELGITGDAARKQCETGLQTLVADLRSALSALDASHDALRLSGAVLAHDRNGDKQVDDLGPSTLSGRWSSAQSDDAESAVSATLRVTPKPVLTI